MYRDTRICEYFSCCYERTETLDDYLGSESGI